MDNEREEYLRWCEHYGYEPWSAESLADWARYQEEKAILAALSGER